MGLNVLTAAVTHSSWIAGGLPSAMPRSRSQL